MLLLMFGFLSQAPGEAEAELAQLSKLGKIDAVLTDDVDALVFGATKILRKSVISPPTIPHPLLRLYVRLLYTHKSASQYLEDVV
jgi:5'-3' exonuclease